MPSWATETQLILQEFRLTTVAATKAVGDIVGLTSPRVPLLTSIADPLDVATIRNVDRDTPHLTFEDRIALAPFVSAWKPAREYAVRFLEHALAPPDHYRMAVTDSGINDRDRSVVARTGDAGQTRGDAIGMLWIADPVGSHAGLLIVIGHYGRGAFEPSTKFSDWPLALSLDLGVRIYEGSTSNMKARAEKDRAPALAS